MVDSLIIMEIIRVSRVTPSADGVSKGARLKRPQASPTPPMKKAKIGMEKAFWAETRGLSHKTLNDVQVHLLQQPL